jgi:hypothetical protein
MKWKDAGVRKGVNETSLVSFTHLRIRTYSQGIVRICDGWQQSEQYISTEFGEKHFEFVVDDLVLVGMIENCEHFLRF